jgi:2-polyprenyl-3-methyl-5-hydroxy-6-metoxy-1,4-benzoquinol methylase
MTRAEMDELFDRDGDTLTVKPWIREVIKWHVGDVGEPDILDVLGPQDIVLANNFLCHMDNPEAERCLRNLARLVTPNGFLFVSGIKLHVRAKVAEHLGWQPVQESLEEILNKSTPDWRLRYAAAFQLVSASDAARCHRLAEEVPTG